MYNQIFSLSKLPHKNNFTLLRMLCCFTVIYEHTVVLAHLDFPYCGGESRAGDKTV